MNYLNWVSRGIQLLTYKNYRLDYNPLRILDSKEPEDQNLIIRAPLITDYLNTETNSRFAQLCTHLKELEINYTVDPKLLRGLDYYNYTVFEFLHQDRAVIAGGRYDGLLEKIRHNKNEITPSIGYNPKGILIFIAWQLD